MKKEKEISKTVDFQLIEYIRDLATRFENAVSLCVGDLILLIYEHDISSTYILCIWS